MAINFYRRYEQSKLFSDTSEDGPTEITILEKDWKLRDSVRVAWGRDRGPLRIECDTVLRIKGLERPFIVWSAMEVPETGDTDVWECAYTAMTRTHAVLIIAIAKEPKDCHEGAIGLLDKNFLIPWDNESEEFYNHRSSSKPQKI